MLDASGPCQCSRQHSKQRLLAVLVVWILNISGMSRAQDEARFWEKVKPRAYSEPGLYQSRAVGSATREPAPSHMESIISISTGQDLVRAFSRIRSNSTLRDLSQSTTFIFTTTEAQIFLDETLVPPEWWGDITQAIFWGPGAGGSGSDSGSGSGNSSGSSSGSSRSNRATAGHPLRLVCRKARTALDFKGGVFWMANLHISGCTDSAITVNIPPAACPTYDFLTTQTPGALCSQAPISLGYITLSNNTGRRGGAIRVEHGIVMLSAADMYGNTAADAGGAVYTGPGGCLSLTSTTAMMGDPSRTSGRTWSRMAGNQAPRGGAMFINNSACRMQAEQPLQPYLGSTFLQGNKAEQGGGLYLLQKPGDAAGTVRITDCYFQGNEAFQAGGALYVRNVNEVTLEGSRLEGNQAGQEGGAVWATSKTFGSMFINSTSFSHNQAGPTLWMLSKPPADTNTYNSISANTFSAPAFPSRQDTNQRSTTAGGNGGAVAVSNAMQLELSGNLFFNNSAELNGGALYCSYTAKVDVASSNFTSNSACSGGAVALDYVGGPSRISNSSFVANMAVRCLAPKPASGRASWMKPLASRVPHASTLRRMPAAGPAASSKHSTVQGRPMTCGEGAGGGLCLKARGMMGLVDNTFINNSASAAGGGLYVSRAACADDSLEQMGPQCTMYLYGQRFEGNGAMEAGGGAFLTTMVGVEMPLSKGGQMAALLASHTTAGRAAEDVVTKYPSPCGNAVTSQDQQLGPTVHDLFTYQGLGLTGTPNTFINNSATHPTAYGPAVATAVACLARAPLQHQTSTTRQHQTTRPSATTGGLPAGHQLDNTTSSNTSTIVVANSEKFNIVLLAFDSFGQAVTKAVPEVSLAVTLAGSLASSTSVYVSGPQKVTTVTGKASGSMGLQLLLLNISILADEYRAYQVLVSASAAKGQVTARVSVPVRIRSCQIGEVQVGKVCKSCNVDSHSEYSFDPNSNRCLVCPENAKCYGASIVPDPGYWHAGPRSNRLYQCPVVGECNQRNPAYHAKAFQQTSTGLQTGDNLTAVSVEAYNQLQCSKGYTGNVCGNCADRYGRKGQKCARCGPQWVSTFAFITLKALEAGLLALLVVARLRTSNWQLFTTCDKEGNPLKAAAGCSGSSSFNSTTSTSSNWKLSSTCQEAADTVEAVDGCIGSGRSFSRSTFRDSAVSINGSEAGSRVWWSRGCGQLEADAACTGGSIPAALIVDVAEILVLYIQILALLGMANLHWPTTLSSLFTALNVPAASNFWISPDCMLGLGAAHVGMFRVALTALSPVGVMAVVVAAFLLRTVKSHPTNVAGPLRLPLKRILVTTSTVALCGALFYYPSVTSVALSVFSCTHLDPAGTAWGGLPSVTASSNGWWQQDYTVMCFVGPHLGFTLGFAVPMVLVVVLGVPVAVTWMQWRSHTCQGAHEEDTEHKPHITTARQTYATSRDQCWFWLCMRFWLLLTLSATVQVFSSLAPLHKLIIMSLCLSIYLILSMILCPYRSHITNHLHSISVYSALVCTLLSIVYAATPTPPSSTATTTLVTFLVSLTLLFLVGVLIVCCMGGKLGISWLAGLGGAKDKATDGKHDATGADGVSHEQLEHSGVLAA